MDRTEMMGAEDEWRMVMWNEGKTRWDWLERKCLAWTGWQKGNWTGNSATRRSAVESRMGTSIGGAGMATALDGLLLARAFACARVSL